MNLDLKKRRTLNKPERIDADRLKELDKDDINNANMSHCGYHSCEG